MSKIILVIFILFLTESIKGQVKLVDAVTIEPVVGANIYSKDGLSLGISDIFGNIVLNTVINHTDSDKILVQHISYDNKEISLQSLNKSKTILLTPRHVQLDSVVLKNPDNYDFIILKGYFRTYDLFNNKPRYFYDGIIEYYIPIKNGTKVYHKLLEYRLFENKESVYEYTQAFGKAFSSPPKIFSLKPESYINYIRKDINLIDQGDKILFMKNDLNMGFIQKTKASIVQFYFDQVPPHSKLSRSFLRIKGEQYRGLILENYSGTNIKNPKLEGLISRTRSTVGAVQRKKGLGLIPMEIFEEFYVLDRTFVKEEDINDIKKYFTKSIYLNVKSDYRERFWIDIDHYDIPPLSNSILKQLNSVLIEK